MNSMRWLPIFPVAGLAGCAATTFQNPTVAELACDARLVGDWWSIAAPESNGTPCEVELKINKTCNFTMIEHKKDAEASSDPTMLHVGRDGDKDYFWLDATWAFERVQSTEPAPAGDVYVLRYVVQDNDLQLYTIDDLPVAHRILNDELKGEVHKTQSTLVNRLTGTVTPDQLRNKIAFGNTKPGHFKLRGAESVK